MTLRRRKLFFLFFVLLFITTVWLVLLYGSGYTIDFASLSITRTGIIFAHPETKDTQLRIDGGPVAGTPPLNIRRLTPRSYDIMLTKEGYLPWSKTLPVYPNETTFVTDMVLFRASQPEIIDAIDPPDALTPPDRMGAPDVADTDAEKIKELLPLTAEEHAVYCKKQNVFLVYDYFTVNTVPEKINDEITRTVLYRGSERILSAQCLGDLPYIAAMTRGGLTIIEMDARDRINIYSTPIENPAPDFTIQGNGESIMFAGTINGVSGIFLLPLQ